MPKEIKKRRCYSPTSIVKAVNDIEKGHLTIYAASKKYGVPRSTLHNKIQGFTPVICKIGPASTITDEEQANLVKWLENVAAAGFPATKTEFLDRVQKLVEGRITPFSNGRPGNRWFKSFLKRNPTVQIKSKYSKKGQEIIGSETTKREREESNEIFLDEISSHMDEDIDEDSISFTESVDPKQQKLQLNTTPFIEFTESAEVPNAKDKSKYYKKPKYLVPGETEETKWLTTKQLERMALIEHINFSKIQREYYAEKLKLMRKQK